MVKKISSISPTTGTKDRFRKLKTEGGQVGGDHEGCDDVEEVSEDECSDHSDDD